MLNNKSFKHMENSTLSNAEIVSEITDLAKLISSKVQTRKTKKDQLFIELLHESMNLLVIQLISVK
jgi:hypothetical protein